MAEQKERNDKLFAAPVRFNDTTRMNGPRLPSDQSDGPSGGLVPLDVTGVAETELTFDRLRDIRHARVTITGLVVSIDESDDFSNAVVLDFANTNIAFLGAETNLSLLKDNSDVKATNILTLGANAANGNIVTVDATVYTFQTSLVDSPNNVLIGGSASDSLDNLIAALTNGAGEGTTYGTGTTANTAVTPVAGTGDTIDFTATARGDSGNSVVTTSTLADGSFTTATLEGGLQGVLNVTDITVGLGTAQASNTTLSSTMDNIIRVLSIVTDASTVFFKQHTIDEISGGSYPLPGLRNGGNEKMFLNITAPVSQTGTVTATGTIDIFYIDLGAVS
ncbi:MAG: hypothetical protein V3S55_15495 [Nitrospiraceae bacterium]